MTVEELGVQYIEQSEKIKKMIARHRQKGCDGSEENLLAYRTRLACLYSMARDCKAVGNYLKDYYKSEDEKEAKKDGHGLSS